MSKKSIKLIVFVCVIGLLIFSSIFIYIYKTKQDNKDGGSQALQQSFVAGSSYSIYHPELLPAGITYNPDATSQQTSGLFTTFTSSQGVIVLTQQPLPPIKIQYVDAKERYPLDIGEVAILESEAGKIRVFIETESSLLLVNADEALGTKTIKDFVASLKKQ